MTKIRILHADDKAEENFYLKKSLGEVEFEIDYVTNSDELVEKAKENQGLYALILTDCDMSDKYGSYGGLHASREIRKFDIKTPIVLLSSMHVSDEALRESGINGKIEKHIVDEKLKFLEEVNKYLVRS